MGLNQYGILSQVCRSIQYSVHVAVLFFNQKMLKVDPTKLFFFANEEFLRFSLESLHFC